MKPYILISALALSLVACSEKPASTESKPASESTESSLSTYFVDTPHADAISIHTLRSQAKAGEQVTFNGKVLGAKTVLVDKRAIMLLGDPEVLISCDIGHDDNCPTPWDVCCTDVDTVNANIVTIQVVDAEGRPLKQGLRGVNNLTELSHVTLSGTVAEGSSDSNMIVNAESIYVLQKP
ncbi:hypothetical protein [Rubritalea marina]|uniref:hypothetical protein n=1 Tax=Rubritalea marina TaxID=361055 RepID=UPI000381021D|nr:hypothetical protein [Rubritalea marina]